MSAKRVKKKRNVSDEPLNADRKGIWRTVAWGLLIVTLFAGLLAFVYKAGNRVNPHAYEGRIVDKWAGYSDTDQGSFPYFRLVIETDGSQTLTVAIDRDNYERAKVGMRIKKTSAGIEMSADEPANQQQLQNRPGS